MNFAWSSLILFINNEKNSEPFYGTFCKEHPREVICNWRRKQKVGKSWNFACFSRDTHGEKCDRTNFEWRYNRVEWSGTTENLFDEKIWMEIQQSWMEGTTENFFWGKSIDSITRLTGASGTLLRTAGYDRNYSKQDSDCLRNKGEK